MINMMYFHLAIIVLQSHLYIYTQHYISLHVTIYQSDQLLKIEIFACSVKVSISSGTSVCPVQFEQGRGILFSRETCEMESLANAIFNVLRVRFFLF